MSKNYQIINSEYVNNGGGNMVGVFTAWMPAENRTLFVNVGEGAITVTTVDHIRHDVDVELESITVAMAEYYCAEAPVDNEYFVMMRYCLAKYLIMANEYSLVTFDWLPLSVQCQITDEQREAVESAVEIWNSDTDRYFLYTGKCATFTDTNGKQFTIDVLPVTEKLLMDIDEFIDSINRELAVDTEEEIEAFYNMQWEITFGKHKLTIDNCAAIFNGITYMLNDLKEELLS